MTTPSLSTGYLHVNIESTSERRRGLLQSCIGYSENYNTSMLLLRMQEQHYAAHPCFQQDENATVVLL